MHTSKYFPLLLGITIGFALSFFLRKMSNQCRANVSNSSSGDVDVLLRLTESRRHHVWKKKVDQILDLRTALDMEVLKQSNVELSNWQNLQPSTNAHVLKEQDEERLVLIGVMTAEKYLTTRAVAVYNTWGRSIPGKIIFFTGGNATKSLDTDNEESNSKPLPNIPLVALPGVDDSYPPQKKSFMMLKYMFDHYGDKYDWFLRADDDLYIRTKKLENFLRSLNSNHLYFIGQAGKGVRAEKETLNLAQNENFCMGGPGILFSQATFRKVVPHVSKCLKDMYSTHEDVEVGRCVHRFAHISCTWAYEMQSIFYHNSSGELAFTESLKHREVHRAITLHPIKDPSHLYRLHSYFQAKEIEERFSESILLQRDLLITSTALGNRFEEAKNSVTEFDSYNLTGLPTSLRKFVPNHKSEIQEWRFIDKSAFYSPNSVNPKIKIDSASKEGLQDVIRELMEMINGLSKVRGRVIEFKELLYGYHRVDPLHGEDFVLDLLMTYRKYRGRKMTVPVRRHAYIQRPFAPLQLRITTQPTNHETNTLTNLAFIVPLAGRFSTFERFLQNYLFLCDSFAVEMSDGRINFKLIIVYFGTDDEKEQFLSFLTSIRQNQSQHSCQVKVVQLDGEFSRGVGLETGISQCMEDDLLFLVDVDVVFSPEAVKRILLNTIEGSQVYFPIVFSEFSNDLFSDELKDVESFQISTDTGYWREFGFGIAAFFKSDFKSVGGFDVSIRGWGKEDVSLFDKFLRTNLTVFRAPDPELLHIYHPITCDPQLSQPQYDMCVGSKASTLGSTKSLLNFIFTNQHEHKRLTELSNLLFRP